MSVLYSRLIVVYHREDLLISWSDINQMQMVAIVVIHIKSCLDTSCAIYRLPLLNTNTLTASQSSIF